MNDQSELKQISYVCPKCKREIDTFIDIKEFEKKEFPIAITDLHEFETEKHANTLYIDEQFIIRAIEMSDFAAFNIREELPQKQGGIKEHAIPIPKDGEISTKNLGYIEKLLIGRIDGKKDTFQLAEELKISEKRVKLLIKKLQVNKYIKEIKRILK